MADERFDLFAEDWSPSYEPPSTFELDGTAAVQSAESATFVVRRPAQERAVPLAFVDGTRRIDLGLWQIDRVTGETHRGIAGSFAVGAAVTGIGRPARILGERVGRVCVWSGGRSGGLGPRHGFHWTSQSVARTDPAEPLNALQEVMRDAEATLAQELSGAGWLVVLDGPLNRIRTFTKMVVGYAKTHRRRLLPDDQHVRVPGLDVGERCPIWAVGEDRYTCYARILSLIHI